MRNFLTQLIDQRPHLALAAAVILAFVPLLNWVALVWVMVIGLRSRFPEATIAFILVCFISAWELNQFALTIASLQQIGIFIALMAPLWLSMWVLFATRSLALSLQAAFALLVVFTVAGIWLFPPNEAAWREFLLCRLFPGQTLAEVQQSPQYAYFESAGRALMLSWPAVCFLLESSLLLLARWVQSLLYYPGGFRADFYAIRLLPVVGLVCALGIIAPNFVSAPAGVQGYATAVFQYAALATTLLFFAGLGFIHWWVAERRWPNACLWVFYLVMAIVGAVLIPLVALVAVFDSGLDLRRRLAQKR